MKTDLSNNERFTDGDDSPEAPVLRTHRLLFGHKIHRSTLLIGLMFMLGAGWVLWESRTVGPKSAVADSVVVDPNITMNLDQMQMEAAIGQARDTRKQQLFGPLLKNAQRRQIRLASLPRDPFELPVEKPAPAPSLNAAAQATDEPAVEETPPSVEGLELRSILIGAVPTAIINGYLVQEGQVISEWKVVEIQPTKVVLQWRNRQHVLTMP